MNYEKQGAVLETAGGTVIVTDEGLLIGLAPIGGDLPKAKPPVDPLKATPPVDPSIGVSASHRVNTDADWQGPIAAMLDELQLHRLRALLEARPVGLGEWFAEHAIMQLAPNRGCSSRPLWLAWMGTVLGEVFAVLWAADERAARRCVLELRLGHAAHATHVLLPHGWHRQLRRCAYESNDLELLPRLCPFEACDADVETHAEPWPSSWEWDVLPAPLRPAAGPAEACDGLAWATLLRRSGEALERLRERRTEAADEDEAAACEKQKEITRQLRVKDPGAEVDVTHEGQGVIKINKISFNGHLFECPVVVNPYCDANEIVRTATFKCLCC